MLRFGIRSDVASRPPRPPAPASEGLRWFPFRLKIYRKN